MKDVCGGKVQEAKYNVFVSGSEAKGKNLG